MIGSYKQLLKYRGENVELYLSGNDSVMIEKGMVTNIVVGLGENGVFLELNNEILINVRYIIKMRIIF